MDRTTSMGLWTWANNFFSAACELQKTDNAHVSAPAYYLISHAIELALKAFLRGNGFSLEDLKSYRKFGHDLDKCLHVACESGLQEFVEVTDIDRWAISTINDYYKEKELEYIATGYKEYPKIELLIGFTERLLQSTWQFCFDKRDLNSGTAS